MRKSWHWIKKSHRKFHKSGLNILLLTEDKNKIGISSGKTAQTIYLLCVIEIKIIMKTYYVPGTLLRVSYAISHLIFTNIFYGRYCYYPCFIDKKTGTDKVTCPRSCS